MSGERGIWTALISCQFLAGALSASEYFPNLIFAMIKFLRCLIPHDVLTIIFSIDLTLPKASWHFYYFFICCGVQDAISPQAHSIDPPKITMGDLPLLGERHIKGAEEQSGKRAPERSGLPLRFRSWNQTKFAAKYTSACLHQSNTSHDT